MIQRFLGLKYFLSEYFDLSKDRIDEQIVKQDIIGGVDFKGAQLWILIFAIFMASLGLNLNSTAVVIGAMLISPLMGPIIGLGFSMGINDFELMKRSLKSLLVTTLLSIIAATIYFLFTPLSEAQSELLARTSPTIYDVFIALFGGFAGFIAVSTRIRGNVIPGVAIATALMPPLCTVGYAIANAQWSYALGAFYLFFINSIFIGSATFIAARRMHFASKTFVDKSREKRVNRSIIAITILTMIPAIYLTYGIVQETIYQKAAQDFINRCLTFDGSKILSKEINYKKREIQVSFIGKEISKSQINKARAQLLDYKLQKTKLFISQGFTGNELDVNSLRSMVLKDFYTSAQQQLELQRSHIDTLQHQLALYKESEELSRRLLPEVLALFPSVKALTLARTLSTSTTATVDSLRYDTLTLALIETSNYVSMDNRNKLEKWLMARTKTKRLKLLIEKE
ncbi:MAG: TIGR00341 family protein [Bacteroidaceae bacterium]